MFPQKVKKIVVKLDPKRFSQYALVGFISYGICALFLEVFYRFGFSPGVAASLASELAIIFAFLMNNRWTFADQRISSWQRRWKKFMQFNLILLGSVFLQGFVVGLLSQLLGDHWRQLYLVFAVGFFVIPYNYTAYNLLIWKTWQPDIKAVKWLQKRLG